MKPLRVILIVLLALGVALLGTAFAVNWAKAVTAYVNVWVQVDEPANEAFPKRIEFVRHGSCDADGETLTYKFKGDTVTIGETQFDVTYDLNHMTLSSASGSASYVSTGSAEQFDFRIEDGGAVITDYHGEQDILVIPSTLGGAPVTRVESGLDHQNFTKIVFPEGITEIESRLLKGCYYLKEVVLPSTTREIGNYAFSFCRSLEKINIPEGVTSITWDTFRGCEMLSSISLPASLRELDSSAFEDCPNLGEVIIAPENKIFKMVDNALFRANETILCLYFDSMGEQTYTIPSGVTRIASEAFYNCDKLQSVIISEGVVRIGNDAFSFCNNLESVSIPASVIDCNLPFYQCSALTSVSVSPANTDYQAQDGFLLSKSGKVLYEYLYGAKKGTIVIPEGVVTIGKNSFENMSGIDRIIFPKSIGSFASAYVYEFDAIIEKNKDVTIVAPKDSAVYAYAESRGLHVEASGN